MNITFLSHTPVYQGDVPSLTFAAVADGERVECIISAEALEDHFGAASWREEDLRLAFESHRSSIEGAAEQMLSRFGCNPVMLRSGYFRFREARANAASIRS
ncbi:periplasmic protein [Caballeronia hypogeia]|uniref:Periplasmic protein n=1 Tax=Caballeronia hypogeia TaxID=1777140 RepID=A0A157ZDT3_9BURK|nr:DUF1488 domain-containing protein [Caballeronia hypogeia]SAK43648.1 periplasmic protein [Caballeronia hypogeia]